VFMGHKAGELTTWEMRDRSSVHGFVFLEGTEGTATGKYCYFSSSTPCLWKGEE
jgi:hypothetical protein